jgi:hypothetical protein
MKNKVSGVYRAGALFIALCSILCFGLMIFSLVTEGFDVIFIFIILLSVSVAYFSGRIFFTGKAPDL